MYTCVFIVCVQFVRRVRTRANTQETRGSIHRYVWIHVYMCVHSMCSICTTSANTSEHARNMRLQTCIYVDMSRDFFFWRRTIHVRHDSFVCETWLICKWDVTLSCVRHDLLVRLYIYTYVHIYMYSNICIYICIIFVWYIPDSFACWTWCETWSVRMWDMTHSYVRHTRLYVRHD